jgi:tetratricopeptide (TPR) repeat protein
MKKISPAWWLALLLTACFTLATLFVPRATWWNAVPQAADRNLGQSASDNVFKLLLGEGRRLFGNEMFAMADAYFHSGYYPSIFDRQESEQDVATPAYGKAEDSDSTSDDFLGPPPDWIAALDRQFVPNRHTHLSTGGPSGHMRKAEVQEILPWLKLATDMNPQFIRAYRVGAYWLRRLGMADEARDFLFEGLHNNPGNIELLFDLGWLYQQNFHDPNRARHVWMAALRCWETESAAARTNTEAQLAYEETAMNLANLEEGKGNWPQAIKYLKIVKQVSPNPDAIQKQIDDVEKQARGDK